MKGDSRVNLSTAPQTKGITSTTFAFVTANDCKSYLTRLTGGRPVLHIVAFISFRQRDPLPLFGRGNEHAFAVSSAGPR